MYPPGAELALPPQADAPGGRGPSKSARVEPVPWAREWLRSLCKHPFVRNLRAWHAAAAAGADGMPAVPHGGRGLHVREGRLDLIVRPGRERRQVLAALFIGRDSARPVLSLQLVVFARRIGRKLDPADAES